MLDHLKRTVSCKKIFFLFCMIMTLSFTACSSEFLDSEENPEETAAETVEESAENSKKETEKTVAEKNKSAMEVHSVKNSGITENPAEKVPETKEETKAETEPEKAEPEEIFRAGDIPEFNGDLYVPIHGNVPYFTEEELKGAEKSFETYGAQDALGRCGVCTASVGMDLMPTEERGKIGDVRPTGWRQNKYPGLVDGNYLYNRCHLIGYQLTGENANTKNLITGTRYFNTEGMLPFENMVADFVKGYGYHVLYRVTPVFDGSNLLADGVLMEGQSVEDDGKGIQFCVFVYNIQPGVGIDYATGENRLAEGAVIVEEPPKEEPEEEPVPEESIEETKEEEPAPAAPETATYAVNQRNGKIHIVGKCSATGTGEKAMKRPVYFNTYEEAEAYSIQIAPNQKKRKCGNCW